MSTRAERPTVLAVDDLPEYLRLYERRLEDEYEVLTAESGAEALDALDDRVDVVLLDRSMPDLSGEAVLDAIREHGYRCRVAMVTASEPGSDVIDRGFDDYLVKPVTTEELTETVERLLRRAEYDADLQELYALCVERAKARADGGVDGDDEVSALEERIREIRDRVDDTVSGFEAEDYRATFRDLPELDE